MSPRGILTLIPLLLAVTAIPAPAQQLVPLDKIRDNVNRFVKVEGTVKDIRRERGGVVWLSLEERYPRGPLVVVLTADLVRTYPNYNSLRDQRVRVTGEIMPGADAGPPPPTSSRATAGSTTQVPRKPYILLENVSRLEVLSAPPG